MSPKIVLIMKKHHNQSKRHLGSADKIGFTCDSPSGHQDFTKEIFVISLRTIKGFILALIQKIIQNLHP